MANSWFRFHNEFSSDPKVQMMSEVMQRRLVMVFCLRSGNVLETLHETEIAFHLRISDPELAETKALFLAKEFIDEDWNVLNWNRRQYLSDSSTERVREYRQRMKQDETFQKHDETVSVTPVTEDETAPEQNRTEHKKNWSTQDVESIYLAYPRRVAPDPAKKAIEKSLKKIHARGEESPAVFLMDRVVSFSKQVQRDGTEMKYIKMPQGWFNEGRYDNDELTFSSNGHEPRPRTIAEKMAAQNG